ncbi:MAG: glycosyltransferase family 39 protein [Actinomycetota bacterium]|nr:glycosyltransferase family 39 protein [Actinomycetota bacterium]
MASEATAERVTETSAAGIPALAWRPVGSAMVALAVVLTVTSGGYGYHRDELYFRMLPPAWGDVDQPPFAPAVVRLMSTLVSDEVWAIRVPATLTAVAAVLLVALLVRELGGGALAQGLGAWGYGFAAFPLVFGHVMLTTGTDLVAWLAATLFVVRAVHRENPRWWLAAGLVVGLATYNKLLIAMLVVALAVGLMAVGPRRQPWRWVAAAMAVAAVLAFPAFVYQATHSWPQLSMGSALTAKNGPANRVQMWPTLLLLLGPVLVPVWVAGWVALLRRPDWRSVRFLGVAFPALLALSFLSAGQVYYPLGLLAVLYAAGCVPVAAWLSRPWRRRVVTALVVVNCCVAAVIALPLVPVSALGRTPVPGINQVARDQVGWPAYVAQVAAVRDSLPPGERDGLVVITDNYGEAGAIARYGPPLGMPTPLSGQNELWFVARPPATRAVAIVVGRGAGTIAGRNATCTVAARLDNGVGVSNEEQRQPVSVCRAARLPWDQVWPQFAHLD